MFFCTCTIPKIPLGQQRFSYYSAEYIFSQNNVKRTVEKFSQMKPIIMHAQRQKYKAAVLIPLCEVEGNVSLLYTLRAAHLKTHRGQVSFPGGKQDSIDESLENTAIRETEEELGIDRERIGIWGTGNLIITRRDTSVLPVIGQINGALIIEHLQTNPSEVEEVFTVTLEDLCRPTNLGYTQFRTIVGSTYSVPVFLGGKHRIWGLTALITHLYLRCLLPPAAYSHCIRYIKPITISNIPLPL